MVENIAAHAAKLPGAGNMDMEELRRLVVLIGQGLPTEAVRAEDLARARAMEDERGAKLLEAMNLQDSQALPEKKFTLYWRAHINVPLATLVRQVRTALNHSRKSKCYATTALPSQPISRRVHTHER
jgi:hypothetical protein